MLAEGLLVTRFAGLSWLPLPLQLHEQYLVVSVLVADSNKDGLSLACAVYALLMVECNSLICKDQNGVVVRSFAHTNE